MRHEFSRFLSLDYIYQYSTLIKKMQTSGKPVCVTLFARQKILPLKLYIVVLSRIS
mgnify:CR=1 FL=1